MVLDADHGAVDAVVGRAVADPGVEPEPDPLGAKRERLRASDQALGGLGIDDVGSANEAGDEGTRRVLVDRLRSSDLLDPAHG